MGFKTTNGPGSKHPCGLRDVTHWAHFSHVVRNVTTEVDQGKLVAVIGPHGSGKKLLGPMVGTWELTAAEKWIFGVFGFFDV